MEKSHPVPIPWTVYLKLPIFFIQFFCQLSFISHFILKLFFFFWKTIYKAFFHSLSSQNSIFLFPETSWYFSCELFFIPSLDSFRSKYLFPSAFWEFCLFPLFILSLQALTFFFFTYLMATQHIYTLLSLIYMYCCILLVKISSVVEITCFFASMYCLCNPLPHLTGFSSFLVLIFSISERALIFSHPVEDLLSFKNPFASSFFFSSHALFGFPSQSQRM